MNRRESGSTRLDAGSPASPARRDHPELDEELGRVARDQGVSKAEMVRRYLRANFALLPPIENDPLIQLFGKFSGGYPGDSERHDDIIYDAERHEDVVYVP